MTKENENFISASEGVFSMDLASVVSPFETPEMIEKEDLGFEVTQQTELINPLAEKTLRASLFEARAPFRTGNSKDDAYPRKNPWDREKIAIKQKKLGLNMHRKAIQFELDQFTTNEIGEKTQTGTILFGVAEPEGSRVIFDDTAAGRNLHLLESGQMLEGEVRIVDEQNLDQVEIDTSEAIVDEYETSDGLRVKIWINEDDVFNLMTEEEAKFKINDPDLKKTKLTYSETEERDLAPRLHEEIG